MDHDYRTIVPALGAHRQQRPARIGLLGASLLVLVGLGGCGSAASAPTPAPRATSTPRVVARANPLFDTAVGRLLAVETVLNQVGSTVTAALAAQSSQLSDAARSNLADARQSLLSASYILRTTGPPAPSRTAFSLLQRATQDYSLAVRDGMSNPDGSQHEADLGSAALWSATSILARSREANQTATLAAEQAALNTAWSVTRPRSTPRPRRARAATRPRPAPSRPATPTPPPAPTPRPTATPTATPLPSPTPTPTRAPTATPRPTHIARKPARTLRSAPRTTPTPSPTRAPVEAAAIKAISHGLVQVDAASATIAQCQSYLASLHSGDNAAGSDQIVQCIDGATRRLTVARRSPGAGSARSSLDMAMGQTRAASSHLARAAHDVRTALLDQAQSELASASNSVTAVQSALRQAQDVLKPA